MLGRAGEEGRLKRLEAAKAGKVTFTAAHMLVMPTDFVKEDAPEDAGLHADAVLDLGGTKTKGQIRFAGAEEAEAEAKSIPKN